jgi:hypothetical protein
VGNKGGKYKKEKWCVFLRLFISFCGTLLERLKMVLVVKEEISLCGIKRRILIKNPLKVFLCIILLAYLETIVRILATNTNGSGMDEEVPFFVDAVSPEEEKFMQNIAKDIIREELSNDVCLSRSCLEILADKFARAFQISSFSKWCVTEPPSGLDKQDYYGLLMVKVPKAASSTAAAITLRIRNQTSLRNQNHLCRVEYDHRLATSYAKAPSDHSFLWTSIRDPTKRSLSRIFFTDVSLKNRPPSDDNILNGLQREHHKFGSLSVCQGGFQVRYTTLRDIPEFSACKEDNRTVLTRPERVVLSVKRIIDAYGFIALVERMDESVVILSMLLQIPLTDVLISSNSKVAGSSYLWSYGKCVKLVKAFVSPVVKEFLESRSWKVQNYGDMLLYMIVNKSLDMTIDKVLGRENFKKKLLEYQRLKALDLELCASTTILPCNKDGKSQIQASRRNCYAEDFGCGYPCIDSMINNDQLHSKLEMN